jgi:hypothetical protein
MEFKEFPKIARLSREIIVTEKIDGTNASVYIGEDGEFLTGSRTQWITPEKDNYGFSRWAHEHKDELMKLGKGHHFGEWWGQGIQRKYDMTEKVWSLFNTSKWSDDSIRPACCRVVPVLYTGMFDTMMIDGILATLRGKGSIASKGFMKPEGVVVYHPQGNILFKKTIEKDETPKSLQSK